MPIYEIQQDRNTDEPSWLLMRSEAGDWWGRETTGAPANVVVASYWARSWADAWDIQLAIARSMRLKPYLATFGKQFWP